MWENIHKRGFQGPSVCFLGKHNEESISHMFFLYPFSKEIWHRLWESWRHRCIHATSLIDFWESLGKPPTKTSFLQVAWMVGLTLILWNLWLERNRRFFCDSKLDSLQLWRKILGRLQETIFAKCDMSESIDPSDQAIVRNLNLDGNNWGHTFGQRHCYGK